MKLIWDSAISTIDPIPKKCAFCENEAKYIYFKKGWWNSSARIAFICENHKKNLTLSITRDWKS